MIFRDDSDTDHAHTVSVMGSKTAKDA